MNSAFRFLGHSATLNTSAHTPSADYCKFEILLLVSCPLRELFLSES